MIRTIALVEKGLGQLAQEEIKELINLESSINGSMVEFFVSDKEQLLKLIYLTQSFQRVGLWLGEYSSLKNLEDLKLADLDFKWKDYFSSEMTFKVEVLNVKGQENRVTISKKVVGQLFKIFDQEKELFPKIDLKNPDLKVFVYFNGEKYYLGLDLSGFDLNSRHYRIFTNSASFKGDIAYFFVRKSGFGKEKGKLLVGFVKDGTLAIEAALLANQLPIISSKVSQYSFSKFPCFKDFDLVSFRNKLLGTQKNEQKIFAFDESKQNIMAAKKNSFLAGVKNVVEFNKSMLDELDVKYNAHEFNYFILQLTQKDEDKLNEIYYQASYLLKSKGNLLLIGRKKFEPSISNKFKLLSKEEIVRGDNLHQMWLLEKK
tara:strand:- start:1670 stop:2788 length:1119 start_codon:yes stop_codon:yes gene_type:complete